MLCKFPRPAIIKHDNRNEFLGHDFKNSPIKNDYGIKTKCATKENPQEKSILELIHQLIANLVKMFGLQNNYLDK